MKKLLLFLLIPFSVHAQRYVCAGQSFTLTDNDSTPTSYNWYKNGAITNVHTNTYTETAGAKGSFYYQVVGVTNTCTSPMSDSLSVRVLPSFLPIITSPITSLCNVPGNSLTLTANAPSGYTYAYQWTRNGVVISGANYASYSVNNETAIGNVTFGVNVSYALNTACSSSASFVVSVVGAPGKQVVQ